MYLQNNNGSANLNYKNDYISSKFNEKDKKCVGMLVRPQNAESLEGVNK